MRFGSLKALKVQNLVLKIDLVNSTSSLYSSMYGIYE